MNKKNTIDYIRPAGAFPQTFEGWEKYQAQFDNINDADDFFEGLNNKSVKRNRTETWWGNDPDLRQHERRERKWFR